MEVDVKQALIEKEKWGYDFTFDCTGVTAVMRTALEVAHRGWGESCVVGVAAAGHEISTRPFQLVTGRVWKGTAFGGWKSRTDVPNLVKRVMTGELNIDPYVSFNLEGLETVNQAVDYLHGESKTCLRAIVNIGSLKATQEKKNIPVIESQVKLGEGSLYKVNHWSESNQSRMTFSIYIPDTKRGESPPPVLYFLSGLTCSDENAKTKSNF